MEVETHLVVEANSIDPSSAAVFRRRANLRSVYNDLLCTRGKKVCAIVSIEEVFHASRTHISGRLHSRNP